MRVLEQHIPVLCTKKADGVDTSFREQTLAVTVEH